MNGHSDGYYTDIDVYDAEMNAWYEYEFKEYFVQCECGASETATQKNLEAFGWHLSKTEYCPKCAAQIRALGMTPKEYELGKTITQQMGQGTQSVLRPPRDSMVRDVRNDTAAVG